MPASGSRNLARFLTHCRERVENSLEKTLEQASPGARLSQALRYTVLGGGKRIRPILAYAGAETAGGKLEHADNAAAALELMHCYSLVHDDLPAMDNDDLRRGKPSLHRAFDDATAILAGDALQSLAFELLSAEQRGVDATTRLHMVHLLATAVGRDGMAAGQALDFEASGGTLALPELETMHRLKTGSLIRASVLLGALSHPRVSESQLTALARFADHIGLAFQIQDDILDVVADTRKLGKPQGSDDAAGKPTWVSLLGLEAARARAQELLVQARGCLEGFDNGDRLSGIAGWLVERAH